MTAEAYLNELQEKQVALSYQKRKLDQFEQSLAANETALNEQRTVLAKEEKDVDNLSKLSAAAVFNLLTGRKEKAARKEEEEYLAAKLRYETLVSALNKTQAEKNRLAADTILLQKEYDRLKEEARRRYPEIDDRFTAIDREKSALKLKIKELEEALTAGHALTDAIYAAVDKLKKAHGWATYDMFARGGLISHMAKYGNIDDAQAIMQSVDYLMNRFKEELRDTDIYFDGGMHEYGEGSRFFDFFFDNIFTDMHVRGEIEDDIERLESLAGQIDQVKARIGDAKTAVLSELGALEQR